MRYPWTCWKAGVGWVPSSGEGAGLERKNRGVARQVGSGEGQKEKRTPVRALESRLVKQGLRSPRRYKSEGCGQS